MRIIQSLNSSREYKIMNKIIIHFSCLIILFISYACYAAQTTPLKFCYNYEDRFPFSMKDGTGISEEMVQEAARKLNLKITLEARPWLRCFKELQFGEYDGILGVSFNEERMEYGVFPMSGFKPNPEYAIFFDKNSLFRLKGSTVSWDGEKFINANNQQIGALRGHAIIKQIQNKGAEIYPIAFRDAKALINMLLTKRIIGFVFAPSEVNKIMNEDESLKGKIEEVKPPIIEKAYYLEFSKTTPLPLKKLYWNELKKLHQSGFYNKLINKYAHMKNQ